MGVVQRQGFKQSIITYLGLAVGAFNLLYLFPKAFTKEEFGIFQFVTRTAQMLYPFALLGVGSLIVRYFPRFRDDRHGHHGFLSFLLMVSLAGLLLFGVAAFIFRDWIYDFYAEKSVFFQIYLPYVLPLVVAMGLAYVFTTYASNFQRIVVPSIFNNFFLKIALVVLSSLVLWKITDFHFFMKGTVVVYFLIIVFLLLYLRGLGQLDFRVDIKFLDRPLVKEMGVYVFYGVLGSVGTMLASQIDVVMVGTLVDLGGVASYTIGWFIADVVDVPRRAIEQISSPLIADAWQTGNREKVGELYRKSVINQVIIGLIILLCIWIALDDLFALIPGGERYAAGKIVVIILGLGKLFEMMSGIDRPVIVYSPYFRFWLYAILALAGINVASNLIFIPRFEVAGAALATTFSVLLFNLGRWIFLYYRFGLHPFQWRILYLWVLGAIAYLVAWAIPGLPYPLLNIPLKVGVTSGLFVGMVYYFRISPDFNQMLNEGWQQVLILIRRAR